MTTTHTHKQRGGKRQGAGRKSTHGGKSVAVRINADLLPLVEQLKATGKLENSVTATELESVQNQKNKIDQLTANNTRLQLELDATRLRANQFENHCDDLKRQADKLRAEISRLERLEHDCQALTANGQRCERTAKAKATYHGVLINVCLQHERQLKNRQP